MSSGCVILLLLLGRAEARVWQMHVLTMAGLIVHPLLILLNTYVLLMQKNVMNSTCEKLRIGFCESLFAAVLSAKTSLTYSCNSIS